MARGWKNLKSYDPRKKGAQGCLREAAGIPGRGRVTCCKWRPVEIPEGQLRANVVERIEVAGDVLEPGYYQESPAHRRRLVYQGLGRFCAVVDVMDRKDPRGDVVLELQAGARQGETTGNLHG